jgi:hypothetical protein
MGVASPPFLEENQDYLPGARLSDVKLPTSCGQDFQFFSPELVRRLVRKANADHRIIGTRLAASA